MVTAILFCTMLALGVVFGLLFAFAPVQAWNVLFVGLFNAPSADDAKIDSIPNRLTGGVIAVGSAGILLAWLGGIA